MFDRKKSSSLSEGGDKKSGEPIISVETIPDVFFGGNDPVIYSPKISRVEQVVESKEKLPQAPVQPKPLQPKIPQKSSLPTKKAIILPPPGSKKKLLLWICLGMVLLAVTGTLLYYFVWVPAQIKKQQQQSVSSPVPPVLITKSAPVDVSPSSTATTTEIAPVVATTTATGTPFLATEAFVFPSLLLGDAVDQDGDGLTDLEEELFGTDSGAADSDKDGYSDAQEVANLYNPKGFAPVKIIDSGIVKEYINPTLGYRLYYPATWEVGAVDPDNNLVLISAIDGDYIEFRSVVKEPGQNFALWLTKNAPDQNITDVKRITDRFNQDIWRRKDWLVAYAESSDRVLVFTYHPRSEVGAIAYRHVIEMMIQSYRPGKTSAVLPEQTVLPTPPTTTQTQ